MSAPYHIHLPVYEGPLDLLLDLIRKQEMDIHNIPISQITGQYLDYLHKLEQLDVNVSADFIYMAATLILIKSKMLLPVDPLASPEEQEDPRTELVNRLVEHEKFKNAAQLLYEKQQLEAHVWSKPDRSLYQGPDAEGELVVSLVDLVSVFQQVLERRKQVARIELRRDQCTVAQMMEVLRAQLMASAEGVDLNEFFESCPSRSAMICSLLAVLELVRLHAVVLTQSRLFGAIAIRKHKMFDTVFAGPVPAGLESGVPDEEDPLREAEASETPNRADANDTLQAVEPSAASPAIETPKMDELTEASQKVEP